MKIKQLLVLFSLIAGCVFSLSSCEDAEDLVPDNTTKALGSFPVSGNTLVDLTNGGNITANRVYTTGLPLSFEVQYWSDEAIQEVNFYQTVGANARELIKTTPYAPSYSKMKSADTLVVSYTVPIVAAGTTIKLDTEIKNVNTLAVVRSLTIKTK